MEEVEVDRVIFEWINPDDCWHIVEDGVGTGAVKPPFLCTSCGVKIACTLRMDGTGKTASYVSVDQNPSYHTWSGVGLIIEKLREEENLYLSNGRITPKWAKHKYIMDKLRNLLGKMILGLDPSTFPKLVVDTLKLNEVE